MAIQFVTYDDADLKSGKFYTIRVNKDLANAVVEVPPSPIHFTDATYINESWNGVSSVEIWRVEKYDSNEKHTNITNVVNWFITKPDNKIIINSNSPITGYIKFL